MAQVTKVSCVYISADSSSRMSSDTLKRAATEIRNAGFAKVVAVFGFEAPTISEGLAEVFETAEARVQIVHNPHLNSDVNASIRTALKLIASETGFAAICFADEPLLRSADFDLLIEAAQENPRAKLISPYYKGVRGNPTLISMTLKQEILEQPDVERGFSYLFETYRNATIHVPMPSDAAKQSLSKSETVL